MTVDRRKIAESAQNYAARNQFEQAIAEYQKLVAADPHDVRALLRIGDLQVRMNDAARAIETYQHVGALYEQQGLHQKAIAVYKQILQIDPDQLALYGRVADLHIKLGLSADAMQALELLAQRHVRGNDLEGLASTYRQILLLDTQNLATRIRYGELLSKLGRGEEAASEFEVACNLLDSAGRVDEWARVAERLVFHRPTNVTVLRRLASFYLERNDARRALPKIQACYKVNPKDVATLDLLATAFKGLGQLPKTISVLKEIARIHQTEGRHRERAEVYQRVLELNPTDSEAREALRGQSMSGSKRPPSVPPAAPATASSAPSLAHSAAPSATASAIPSALASSGLAAALATTSARPAVAVPVPVDTVSAVDVVEVHDDAIEEVSDEVEAEPEAAPQEVVFNLSQRPSKPSTSNAGAAPEIPAAPRAPMVPDEPEATTRHAPVSAPPATRAAFVPRAPEPAPTGPHSAAGEAARLLAEAEIFMKYGLRSKAMAHITRAAELEPSSVDILVRVRDFYAAMNDASSVLRCSLRVAELLEPSDPDAALAEASRALDIDSENPTARALYERLGGQYVSSETSRDEGSLIDEGDVMMAENSAVEVLPLPAGPADYFAPGYDDAQYALPSYADAGDATEIGVSPLNAYHTDEQLAHPYTYDNHGIPVVIETDHTVRGPSLRPGRREIEEGLDEAEFFVTQGLYDDARTSLQELLATYPNHPLVLERLEEVEQLAAMQGGGYDTGDPSYALADKIAEEVENLNPLDGPPTGQIDVETVLAQFRQGVGRTVSIEDCDTHYDLGIAYKEMALLDDAIAEFKIATMNPARQCIGETMIGICYMEKGDVAQALEHFKQGLQAQQRSEREELGLYFEMGNAYESVGDLSEALYYFQKVDKRDPSFRNVRQRVARLHGAMHGVSDGGRSPARDDVDRSFDEYLKD